MTKTGRSIRARTWLGFSVILVQSGFLILAVFPAVVLCHRPEGPAVLEFGFPGGCACQECEHCLERRARPSAARPEMAAITTCHCRHERLMSEAGTAGLLPERKAPALSSPPCAVAAGAAVPEAMTPGIPRLPACMSPPPSGGPPRPAFLRC